MRKPKRRELFTPIEQVVTFYAIAYGTFLQVQRIVEQRRSYEDSLQKKGRESTEDDYLYLVRNRLTRADEESSAMITAIFSALALEGLINDYLITRFSRGFLDSYLDRLSPKSKWLVFPWLATGRSINTDGVTFQLLDALFSLRNRLVHFKGSRAPLKDSGQKDRVGEKEAHDAVRTVRLATSQLKRFDSNVSTLWLETSEEAGARQATG